MKRTLLLFGLFLISFGPLGAQNNLPDVEVTHRRMSDGKSQEIIAQKNKPGSYTVFIRFTMLQNIRQAQTYRTTVRGDNERLLTLQPEKPDQGWNFNYRYWYIRGYKPSKLDSSFVYRLPYSTGKSAVRALSLYNLNERHFDDKPSRGWSSFEFMLEKGDTVFAMRKGQVVNIVDQHDPLPEEMSVSYHSESNDITIEHPDGTTGMYRVFERGSMLVKEGDMVYPGTPLGLAGSFSENGNYMIRFHVAYPELNRNYKEGDPANSSVFEWVFYNPYFLTTDGVRQLSSGETYRSASSPELVQREMTKREIKAIAD